MSKPDLRSGSFGTLGMVELSDEFFGGVMKWLESIRKFFAKVAPSSYGIPSVLDLLQKIMLASMYQHPNEFQELCPSPTSHF
jgi:hypothetical protein